MGFSDVLWRRARETPVVRIGVGVGANADSVVKSVEALKGLAEFIVVSSDDIPSRSCRVLVCNNPGEVLVDLLWRGEVNACVRGSLGAKEVLGCLKRKFGVDELLRISARLISDCRGSVMAIPVCMRDLDKLIILGEYSLNYELECDLIV